MIRTCVNNAQVAPRNAQEAAQAVTPASARRAAPPRQTGPAKSGGPDMRYKLAQDVIELGRVVIAARQQLENSLEQASPHGVLTPGEMDRIVNRCVEDAHRALNQRAPQSAADVVVSGIRRRLEQACTQLKWQRPGGAGAGGVQWEKGAGQMLLKQGLSFQHVTLKYRNIGEGAIGSVSLFETGEGSLLVGKCVTERSDDHGQPIDDMKIEYEGYRTIYERAGPHRNVLNVYGIGMVAVDGVPTRMLLMDAVPGGQTGEEVFNDLRYFWHEGKISTAQYWSAVQFIVRRLLDATEHLGKAGVVHGDIKPNNFLVDENTGELVLFDLDCWKQVNAERDEEISPDFAPPEKIVANVSNVFMAGAALLYGVEGYAAWDKTINNGRAWNPNHGLEKIELDAMPRSAPGQLDREAGMAVGESDYTRFLDALLNPVIRTRVIDAIRHPGLRPRLTSAQAKTMPFLTDSMLDDAASAQVLTRVITWSKERKSDIGKREAGQHAPLSREEERALAQEKVRFHLEKGAQFFRKLDEQPDLVTYAGLHYESGRDPALRRILDDISAQFASRIVGATRLQADALVQACPWYSPLDRLKINTITRQRTKSGVNGNGRRLVPDSLGEDLAKGKREVAHAKRALQKIRFVHGDILARYDIDDIKKYACEAERFLALVPVLEHVPSELGKRIERVRRRAIVSRHLVELEKSVSVAMRGDSS